MKKQAINFILLNGAMGSGKSTIAKVLKKKLNNTAIIEIEDIRKLLTQEDNALAWKIIYRMCDEYFKNGVSVLLNQTVASVEIAENFIKLAKKYKCNIGFYHLVASTTELKKRISLRNKPRTVTINLVNSNISKHALIKYPNAYQIDTSKTTPTQASKIVMDNLSR